VNVNGKMRPVGTMGRERIKENDGRGEFKYDIWYNVRTFVNATMYPSTTTTKKENYKSKSLFIKANLL
jgi:hypothetical protein